MEIPEGRGPVSLALEAELRRVVGQYGVVLWLDRDQHYSALVDRWMETGGLPFELKAWRGSYLALMLALEGVAGGVDKPPLLIHLPGFNEETVKASPLFELYRAGFRFRKALDTLVTEAAAGRVAPEAVEAFKQRGPLSLAAADAWLETCLAAAQGGLGAQLNALSPEAVMDDLLSGGYVAQRMGEPEARAALWAWLGMDEEWRAASARPEEVAFSMARFALCVEYVDDLKRAPLIPRLVALKALPVTVRKASLKLAAHLRARHPEFYQRSADETEGQLLEEVEAARAEDLGRIDTFRFEEINLLKAALTALKDSEWALAADYAAKRLEGKAGQASIWLSADPLRLSAWQLVAQAAALGLALAEAGETPKARGRDDLVEHYLKVGAVVDQAHRHLEQQRTALLTPQLPEFERLRACLDHLRRCWRRFGDGWALAFNARCAEEGFLPKASAQQRTVFEEVVAPLTQEPGPTALFMVDALRYEMGLELAQAFKGEAATTCTLEMRLAELPTVTEVGMNALAPLARLGRLKPALGERGQVQGFSTGAFKVDGPESRRRAMHDRVGGGACPWWSLDEVLGRDGPSLKRALAQAKLLVVQSQEIDQAGEKGLGPAVFNLALGKLRAAWSLLREAGVRRFVFTSDHGFLFLDESAASLPHGRRSDPRRRHVYSTMDAAHEDEIRVGLASLGYEGAEGFLLFPRSTAVFDTGRHPQTFVHGGNSLQERVIPVLRVVHRAAAGSNLSQYRLKAAALEAVGGMHCLELLVENVAQQSLDFGALRALELAVRVVEAEAVQVELCQVRGKGQLAGGALLAQVGEKVELFFKLTGPVETRVQVEVFHPGGVAQVSPAIPEARFAVGRGSGPTQAAAQVPSDEWLKALPEEVRPALAHLGEHGTLSEADAIRLLGGPRSHRRFTLEFESHARRAPFSIRIESHGGLKHYVREERSK